MNAEKLRHHARDLVADWPALTPQQCALIRGLMQPAVTEAAEAGKKSAPGLHKRLSSRQSELDAA